ncbi:MAG: DUF4364 family protein [Clostridia bacterium]|nr:DUF4364 family protein [Clostridia bacterium]
MEHDAFTSGVAPGGLLNSQEIRILICYMLSSVDEPMLRQSVVEIIFAEGMANFFETEAAIEELIHLGNLTEDENGLLTISPTGRDAAATLTTRIPYTLRERSVEAAVRLLTRQRRERENRVDIVKLDSGVAVTCSIDRTDNPMMSFTLRVADEQQANLIRERFLDDPITVYRLLICLLSGEAQVRKFGNHTILDLPR